MDPIPALPLGHAAALLQKEPIIGEGFTAIEQPILTGQTPYKLLGHNVIERPNSVITVQSVDGNTTYTRDIDYVVNAGVMKVSQGNRYPVEPATAWTIQRTLFNSRISDNQKVRVTYSYIMPKTENYGPCEPLALARIKGVIGAALTKVKPKYIHLTHDEIRYVGHDLRCRATNKSNAQIFADAIIEFNDYTHTFARENQLPFDVKVMLWADSMDLHQNAAALDTRHLIDLLPNDKGLILSHWNYQPGELGWMNANMQHSTSRGFDSMGTTWYDQQNAFEWAQTLTRDRNWNGLAKGIILAAWGTTTNNNRWGALETMGAWAWSSRKPVVDTLTLTKQTARAITQIPVERPINTTSVHMPFFENFDNIDNGDFPVPWTSDYTPSAVTDRLWFGSNSSGKSFEVSGTRRDTVHRGAFMYFDDAYGFGKIRLSHKIWIDSKAAGTGLIQKLIEFHGGDNTFAPRVVLRIAENGLIKYDIPTSTKPLTVSSGYSIPQDKWVGVDIVVDIDNTTWSAWVDNVPVVSQVSFAVPRPDIAMLRWIARRDVNKTLEESYNGFWIDDVSVEHLK